MRKPCLLLHVFFFQYNGCFLGSGLLLRRWTGKLQEGRPGVNSLATLSGSTISRIFPFSFWVLFAYAGKGVLVRQSLLQGMPWSFAVHSCRRSLELVLNWCSHLFLVAHQKTVFALCGVKVLALSLELLALLNTASDFLQLCRVLNLHTLLCFRKLESNKLAVQSE